MTRIRPNTRECLSAVHQKVSVLPHLGTRECTAFFKLLPEGAKNGDDLLKESRDFGLMLYDIDFDSKELSPMLYHAYMRNGVIEVPDINSEEILR